MDLNSIILIASGFIITTLIGIVSFFSKERLESLKEEIKQAKSDQAQSNLKFDSFILDNNSKLDAIAAEVISVKSKILEVSTISDKIENKINFMSEVAKGNISNDPAINSTLS